MYKLLYLRTEGPRTVLQAEGSYVGERVLSSCTQCAVLCTVKAKIKIFPFVVIWIEPQFKFNIRVFEIAKLDMQFL